MLKSPDAPVILEASHPRFHPAWSTFLSLFDSSTIEEASARSGLPAGLFPLDDIRFQYDLAGGTLMDFGHYPLAALRGVFGTNPTSVVSATPRLVPEEYDPRCEECMMATYAFPNGGVGSISADLQSRSGYWFPWLTSRWPSFRNSVASVHVKLREEAHGEQDGLRKSTQRTLINWMFMSPQIWHRIDVTTTTLWRDGAGKVVKQEKQTEYVKAYTWPQDSGKPCKGEEWWPTYRWMLEEFVNKVKKREGSGVWIDGEESIGQAEVTDKTYEKAGMLVRPTSAALET